MKLYPLRRTFPCTTEKQRGLITRSIMKRILSQMVPVSTDHRPHAALFAGVIEQAVKDLWINEDSRTQSPAESEAELRVRVMELRKARQSAQRYLHADHIYHAEMLGIDSRYVSQTITSVFEYARRQGFGQPDRDDSEADFSDPTERSD